MHNNKLQELVDAVAKKDSVAVDAILEHNPALALEKLDGIDKTGQYPIGQSIMHIVASTGDTGMARTVLAHIRNHREIAPDDPIPAIDALLADADKNRPIHWAAIGGHLDMVKLLEREGSDITAANIYGTSALGDAVRHGHTHIARHAVESKGPGVLLQYNGYGNSPLHSATNHYASLDTMRYLITQMNLHPELQNLINKPNTKGFTPLDVLEKHWMRNNHTNKPPVEGTGVGLPPHDQDGFQSMHQLMRHAGAKNSEKWLEAKAAGTAHALITTETAPYRTYQNVRGR